MRTGGVLSGAVHLAGRGAGRLNGALVARSGVSVQRLIPAEPAAIFDLLADPSRHQEFDGSGTVRTAAAGSSRLALGDRFTMGMKVALPYQMVNEVVAFQANRQIAWQPRPAFGPARHLLGGRIWRYELQPAVGGTLVRESWDLTEEALPLLVAPLRGMTRTNMAKTLARIEVLVTKKAVA